jgi:TolA-binding protein
MKKILLTSIAFLAILSAEPSAFSAGDLSQDEPYGLTENEKLLLKNIKSVKYLNRDKNVIHSDVDQLKIDLDGLRSVLNSLNNSSQKTKKLIKRILETQDDLEVETLDHRNKIQTLDANVTTLSAEVIKIVQLQNENYAKIQEDFKAFDTTLSKIESDYVSKKSFDALQLEMKELRTLISKEFKKLNKSPKKSTQKSGATYFKEGNAQLKSKKYKAAIKSFTASIEKRHKPASSHFYVGESHYQLKQYKKAISFFKESYKRYKKGKYNAKLFLHMGISLHELGEKSKAKKIFQNVVQKYPNTAYAKAAKKYL